MTMSNADVDTGVTRATRRVFTGQYKARMVAEYDAATGRGERGALLRREGLFDSHIGKCAGPSCRAGWRRHRPLGLAAAVGVRGRGNGP